MLTPANIKNKVRQTMKNSNPKGVLGIGLAKQGLFTLSERRAKK